jgi:hypothetical protein
LVARRPGRPIFILIAIALLALVAAACFAYPMYVIRPFRHQGATELAIALAIIQIRPWLSIISAILCFAVAVLAWPRLHGKLARALVVASVLIAAASWFLARINVYELMFHPAGRPQFEPADRAKIDKDDMVIAVRANGSARAYPIREMAYHHVVNDTFAGEPIIATY